LYCKGNLLKSEVYFYTFLSFVSREACNGCVLYFLVLKAFAAVLQIEGFELQWKAIKWEREGLFCMWRIS
jgi:hypothetical protein